MPGTFKFDLVSPERVLMSLDVDEVSVPGANGDFTVLVGHSPVVANLRPGVLSVKSERTTYRVFVKSGFADVQPDGLTVLAKEAIEVSDLSGARLASEIEAAETAFRDAKTDEAKRFAYAALEELKAIAGGTSAGGRGH
jgi:F-type H+-transporting ATPase subunit epsilon